MKCTPLVSVIIPCFNSEATIARCIESVICQSYENLELIVVDDGSMDRTCDVVNNYHTVKLIKQSNQGAPSARNSGLSVASGELVKFLDADDMLLPDCILRQVEKAINLPANAVVYGDYLSCKNGSQRYVSTFINFKKQVVGLFFTDILTSTPLHRKSLLHSVGGFDTSLPRGQEWNLHIRLAAAGVIFFHYSFPVYKYIQEPKEHRISIASKKGSDSERLTIEFDKEVATHEAVKKLLKTNLSGLKQLRFLGLALSAKSINDESLFFRSIREAFPRGLTKPIAMLHGKLLYACLIVIKLFYFSKWKGVSGIMSSRFFSGIRARQHRNISNR